MHYSDCVCRELDSVDKFVGLVVARINGNIFLLRLSNMDKFQIQKLKGKSNWTVWKLQIQSNLQYHDFEGILDGQITEPDVLPADATNQQKKDQEARLKLYRKGNGFAVTLLSTTVEDEPMQLIVMFKTAKEMWEKLQATFEQRSEQRLEHLYMQLLEYKKDSVDSVATHVSKLQKLWLELNEESWRIDACKLPRTLLVMRILSTLPEEYFEFRTTWESVPRDQRTIEYLLERLTMVEMRVSKRLVDNTSAALIAKGQASYSKPRAEKQKFSGNKSGDKPAKDYSKIKCYACGQMGHTKYRCPTTKKKANPRQEDDTVALFGEAFVSTSAIDESNLWFADTGASHHMTKSKCYFESYSPFAEPRSIMIGNRMLMMAYGSGNIAVEALVDNVWKSCILKDVLFTPDCAENLFSVSTATEKGIEYWASRDSCRLTKAGATLVVGEKYRRLYRLFLRMKRPDIPAEVYVASKVETLQVWHERLGHQSKQYVEKYLKKHGINFIKDRQLCEGCILGKQQRFSFGTRVDRATAPGELIHADVCGPMQEDSFKGFRYFVDFKDDYSRYRSVFFLKKKSEVVDKLKILLAQVKTLGHTVKELLTDGGGEFDNSEVRSITQQAGLNHRMSMPYTPEQNGAAERENRTLMEAARSMLQAKQFPNKLWAEAVNTAAYVLNRTGPTKVEDKTPYELWKGKKATSEHLRIFGTECFVHVPSQRRQKLDAKSIKGYLVGYSGDKDGYRIYIPERDDIVLSRDVIFKDEQTASTDAEGGSDNTEVATNIVDVKLPGNEDVHEETHRLRDRRLVRQPQRFDDYAMFASFDEPKSHTEAVTSENSSQWQAAMEDEMTSLNVNNTWELVDRQEEKKVIDCRWVYKVKQNADGSAGKFKARLVARGFTQEPNVDYTETYSPVARFDTIRTMLSVASSEKLSLAQFDVKTAFLYGDLEEVIYMKQPTGYDDGTGRVCKLNRSLYGLKQSPRCWNKKFTDFLHKYGLKSSEADPCLFFSSREGHKLLIVLYVDDGLVASQDSNDLDKFLTELKSQFSVTVSAASCFLGIQISQWSDGSIALSQEGYVKNVLQRFNMSECNVTATPVDKNCPCSEAPVSLEPSVPYREAVGSLMYLAVCTRPDIAYAVSLSSQVLDRPTTVDWMKVKRIMKYLKGTSQLGIVYRADQQAGVLVTFSDADYAGDISTRRSTSGVVCQYVNSAISWMSQRQKSVALSTTEAEFIAASEAAKETIWLKRLLSEVTTLVTTPVLMVDNMSAIKLVKNPVFHKRSKHIEVRHYFVREKVDEGQLVVEHVPGDSQVADILTKPLGKNRFQQLRDMLGMGNIVLSV